MARGRKIKEGQLVHKSAIDLPAESWDERPYMPSAILPILGSNVQKWDDFFDLVQPGPGQRFIGIEIGTPNAAQNLLTQLGRQNNEKTHQGIRNKQLDNLENLLLSGT